MVMTKEGWIKRKLNGNGIPWNKGIEVPSMKGENNPRWKDKINISCWECKKDFKVMPYRKETAHFCSASCSSKYRNQGKRTADKIIRQSVIYKAWRKLVFERDNYTCVLCEAKNGNGKFIYLHADHIKPFALHPELRFEVSNGRTLCVTCHLKTETYGRGAIYRKGGKS